MAPRKHRLAIPCLFVTEINTGTVINKLDSVIFAIYADPDLGDAWDDLIGCDTLLNSGYIYNNGNDSEYGNTPPAFFMKYLQGPVLIILESLL